MNDLSWHDFFEIGVQFIDDDHKRLLSIMLNTRKAIEEGDNKKCVQLLTSLLKEANDHFEREEKYLLEVKYPELEEHKKYHRELLVQVETTKRICEGIETEHDLSKCFDGMARFLIDDILKGDINFKSYLQYEGYVKDL
ncbi:MAG: hypothetical protein DIZ80_15545 [endosymbiont of Galathealinum brachiosum]|uniref:Hemerythrin-like domain-containing protein n=1 Tax=endosymbiont of Galathealinum brachiosum TaxID=2200906 RepID=A0A370D9A3_9GAMM|nr:MAG: hypothetical protein DIZ80_15545 [endosymbiont of Galathealinum brachiosum]